MWRLGSSRLDISIAFFRFVSLDFLGLGAYLFSSMLRSRILCALKLVAPRFFALSDSLRSRILCALKSYVPRFFALSVYLPPRVLCALVFNVPRFFALSDICALGLFAPLVICASVLRALGYLRPRILCALKSYVPRFFALSGSLRPYDLCASILRALDLLSLCFPWLMIRDGRRTRVKVEGKHVIWNGRYYFLRCIAN